jgi:hypothetical protein
MLRAEAPEVIILSPQQEVFDHYADGRCYTSWLPGSADMQLLTPGPVGVGAAFKGKFPGYGDVSWEIAEYDPPRRMVHIGHAPIGDVHHTLSFERVDGGTRLRQSGEGELRGIFRLLGPIITPLVRRGMAKNWHQTALHLKRHLEGRDKSGG